MAASVDQVPRVHVQSTPMVAFQCGYRSMHTDDDGHWVSDKSTANCLTNKFDILDYCRRVSS